MYVEALDLGEGTGGAAIGSDELSDNSDGLAGIDCLSNTEESCVAHAVWVEVTSVCVTFAGVASAVIAGAHSEIVRLAGVRCHSVGHGVCFPDIHLRATAALVSFTRVGAVGVWCPALGVGLCVSACFKSEGGD